MESTSKEWSPANEERPKPKTIVRVSACDDTKKFERLPPRCYFLTIQIFR